MPAVVSLCFAATATMLLTTAARSPGVIAAVSSKNRVARTLLSAALSSELASTSVGIASKSGSGACTLARFSEATTARCRLSSSN